ncbi:uncharacterized protein LOC141519301 [Macrotis lagotis]|uniref:uncharacterized protein LOC141519301 n=1 Tax=Macrotis lagotis TaxID=92651 RepID=UPI003D68F957
MKKGNRNQMQGTSGMVHPIQFKKTSSEWGGVTVSRPPIPGSARWPSSRPGPGGLQEGVGKGASTRRLKAGSSSLHFLSFVVRGRSRDCARAGPGSGPHFAGSGALPSAPLPPPRQQHQRFGRPGIMESSRLALLSSPRALGPGSHLEGAPRGSRKMPSAEIPQQRGGGGKEAPVPPCWLPEPAPGLPAHQPASPARSVLSNPGSPGS